MTEQTLRDDLRDASKALHRAAAFFSAITELAQLHGESDETLALASVGSEMTEAAAQAIVAVFLSASGGKHDDA